MPEKLTQKYIKSILEYNSKTGSFKWKERDDVGYMWNSRYPGKEAGRTARNGYKEILIWKKHYQASRIAWLYIYGSHPVAQIDHIDGNKLNNKISNLRQASNVENMRNRRKQKNNTSGYKGVFYNKTADKWTASITVEKKVNKFLGSYKTPELAYAAYCAAAKRYHGEFARTA